MHLAILMTNTDETPFADDHPRDGEKFQILLNEARPDWTFEIFTVKDGVFPNDISGFDGFIITGSPASVRDGDGWIDQLAELIRDIAAKKKPMYGACFGHQAIAAALGGTIDYNPGGWVLGTVETTINADSSLLIYGAHKEQVMTLPKGAEVSATTPGCPIAGFTIGGHVLTTQYHPEMTDGFIAALVDEMEKDMPRDIIDRARASLVRRADRHEATQQIVTFFERN